MPAAPLQPQEDHPVLAERLQKGWVRSVLVRAAQAYDASISVVRVDHRLVLFYLANDVIQYSKRKRYEFVECWATALQRATTMVR